jgi:hypothetical protein
MADGQIVKRYPKRPDRVSDEMSVSIVRKASISDLAVRSHASGGEPRFCTGYRRQTLLLAAHGFF